MSLTTLTNTSEEDDWNNEITFKSHIFREEQSVSSSPQIDDLPEKQEDQERIPSFERAYRVIHRDMNIFDWAAIGGGGLIALHSLYVLLFG